MPSIAHLLNRLVTVKRMTRTSDGQGGYTEALATVSSLKKVKARRSPASGSDRFIAGQEQAVVTHVWYFNGSPAILYKDVIVDGSLSYEVLGTLPPSRPDHLKVQTREILRGG